MKNVLVSIVVPCYNSERFIAKTLESVLGQTYKNWECILINDGSTDNTAYELDKFIQKDTRFVYVYQENKGLSGARNTGIHIAKGEFIYFLDADDLLNEVSLESLISLITNDVDIVIGKSIKTKGHTKRGTVVVDHNLEEKKVYRNNEEKSLLKWALEKKIACVAWNKLYRTSFILENKITFKEGLLHEDELWFFETLFYSEGFILAEEITYFYNIGNADSITNNFNFLNLKAYVEIIDYIYLNYLTKNKNSLSYDIIVCYIIYLKKVVLTFAFKKLLNSEKTKAKHYIISKFNTLTVKRKRQILSNAKEKEFYTFQAIENMPITWFLFYFTNSNKVFYIKFLKKMIRKIALILNSITQKVKRFI